MTLDNELFNRRKANILGRERSLDTALLPLGNPAGKDVLVFGCGLGNEILWCATHQAKSAIGIDLAEPRPEPLATLLKERGHVDFDYQILNRNVLEMTASHKESFDLIISNGVFEHVMDLKGTLNAFRPILRRGGRVAIYADGLWFSAIGGHLGLCGWEHLCMTQAEIREKFPERWGAFTSRLNRMTAADFMNALRDVGALVLQFKIRSDPYIRQLPQLMDTIRHVQQVSPTDLSITSISCEICWLEHL